MLNWDFYSAVTVNRAVSTQPTLPTSANDYGNAHIVDNQLPIIQRTFTCDHAAYESVEDMVNAAKTRYSCIKLSATIMGEYTGRLISFNAQQVPGADSFACTLVLQDMDDEISGTPSVVFDIS